MSVTASEATPETGPYYGLFSSWEDVASYFGSHGIGPDGRKEQIPEPDEVFFAAYDYEDYSGSAAVVYRRGDKFFTVEGGHCSCYGLEDQWAPEPYESREQIIASLQRNDAFRYRDYGAKMLAALGAPVEVSP